MSGTRRIIPIVALAAASVAAADQRVSLEQLFEHSDKYNGSAVAVEAYVTLEFEGDRLCPDTKAELAHCLWLDILEPGDRAERMFSAEKRWRPFNGKRVVIHGTFNQTNKGHRGLFRGGAIEKVTSIDISKP